MIAIDVGDAYQLNVASRHSKFRHRCRDFISVNAGINPLTGLLQVPNGYLATNAVARSLMNKAAKETEAVALAQNIILPYADAAEEALRVAQATATNRSSMAQDVA